MTITVPEWLMIKVLRDQVMYGEFKPLTKDEETQLQHDILRQVFESTREKHI